MTFERVDYLTTQGKQSSAYYEKRTQTAYDVYTREPVILAEEAGAFTEWSPPVKQKEEKKETPIKGATNVALKPVVSLWQIIPVGCFGLLCIWLELASQSLR